MEATATVGRAWAFRTNTGGRLIMGMTHSLSDAASSDLLEDCRWRNDTGESLGADCFPAKIWPSDATKDEYSSLPDLFFAGSFWVASERLAEILRAFDLGGGHLHPVSVTTPDLRTPVNGGPWYCLNVGNRKQALLPEHSSGLSKKVVSRWYLQGGVTHDDLALDAGAAAGPDIWIDSGVRDAIFFSAGLGDAINASEAGKPFRLFSCRLLAGDGA